MYNATELCILKLLEWQIFFCVFNHNKKKNSAETRLAPGPPGPLPTPVPSGHDDLPKLSLPSCHHGGALLAPTHPVQRPSPAQLPRLWPVVCFLCGRQHAQLPFSAISSLLGLKVWPPPSASGTISVFPGTPPVCAQASVPGSRPASNRLRAPPSLAASVPPVLVRNVPQAPL